MHLGPLILMPFVVTLVMNDEVRAQMYRAEVGVPPAEVYRSLLEFVSREEYPKVVGSLNIILPIIHHITIKFKEDPAEAIKKAVKKGDPDDILLSVQALIILDIKDLLDEALRHVEESPEEARNYIKIARLNYEVLSSYVQKKDFAADQRIKKNFTDTFRALGTETLYSETKREVNTDYLRRLWTEIGFHLTRVFPSPVF